MGNNQVPHIAFLARIRRLFTTPSSPHLDVIANALALGTLRQPAQPMSDHELARAIREFHNMPLERRGGRALKPGWSWRGRGLRAGKAF
jgi:hypothetical protein